MTDDVKKQLRKVFLTHSSQTIDEHIKHAIQHELSYEQFIKNMLDDEITHRKAKRIETRIRQAKIPVMKSMEQFDFSFPKKIPKQLIVSLFSWARQVLVKRTWPQRLPIRHVYMISTVVLLQPLI